jgi:preprotein translocase subunit SecE
MTHAELGYRGTKAMEVKNGKPASIPDTTVNAKKAADFAGNVKAELFRITWPSWEELKVYTQIVVAATFLLGIGLYVIDLSIQTVLNTLSMLTRVFSG